jgi:hypothetical protein
VEALVPLAILQCRSTGHGIGSQAGPYDPGNSAIPPFEPKLVPVVQLDCRTVGRRRWCLSEMGAAPKHVLLWIGTEPRQSTDIDDRGALARRTEVRFTRAPLRRPLGRRDGRGRPASSVPEHRVG